MRYFTNTQHEQKHVHNTLSADSNNQKIVQAAVCAFMSSLDFMSIFMINYFSEKGQKLKHACIYQPSPGDRKKPHGNIITSSSWWLLNLRATQSSHWALRRNHWKPEGRDETQTHKNLLLLSGNSAHHGENTLLSVNLFPAVFPVWVHLGVFALFRLPIDQTARQMSN